MFVRAHEFEFVWQVPDLDGVALFKPSPTLVQDTHAAPSHTVTNLLERDNNLSSTIRDCRHIYTSHLEAWTLPDYVNNFRSLRRPCGLSP